MKKFLNSNVHLLFRTDLALATSIADSTLGTNDVTEFLANKLLPFCESSIGLRSSNNAEEKPRKKEAEALSFTIAPNPAGNVIRVEFDRPVEGVLSVSDHAGRLVLERKMDGTASALAIETGALLPGIYFLRVKTAGAGFTASKKFIVQR
jgi:hypothetical protein